MTSLDRFIEAQDAIYTSVISELKTGRKRTHWMWFIFPQLDGLGQSEMSRRYGISSLEEARAYLAHPMLGSRLVECTELLLARTDRSAVQILGSIDALKFRSSMTLFAMAAKSAAEPFQTAIHRYCGGEPDLRTLELLGIDPSDFP